MSASHMARKRYANTQKRMSTDTELELKIFTDITGRLAAADSTKPGGISALNQAVTDNARLWQIIFLDLINSKNCLDNNLKASLIYLSEFTRDHTAKVLQTGADHRILIEINNNIITGKRRFLGGEKIHTEAA